MLDRFLLLVGVFVCLFCFVECHFISCDEGRSSSSLVSGETDYIYCSAAFTPLTHIKAITHGRP